MKKHVKLFSILLIIITFSSSCTHLVQRQISQIDDRNFTLTAFNYSHLGSNEENVFRFYKEFPVKKLMYLIAKEFNLVIDISEFQKFTVNGSSSDINVKRGFRKEHFSWDNKKSPDNRIIIHYQRDYFDQKDPEVKVTLIHGSRTIEIFQTEIGDYDYLFKRVAGSFKTGEDGIKEFEQGGLEKITPVTGVVEYSDVINTASNEIDAKDKRSEIQALLNDYVKDMDKEQKGRFRHEMLDFIYKITE